MTALELDIQRAFNALHVSNIKRTLYAELALMGLWGVWVFVLQPFSISESYSVMDDLAGDMGAGVIIVMFAVAATSSIRLSAYPWMGGVFLATGWAIICSTMAAAAPTSTGTLVYGAHTVACAWYTYRHAQLWSPP